MEFLLRDIRYALRTLRRRPVFTAIAVVSLALGIGANSAIFSLVNGILFQPLPGIEDPGRLVRINTYSRSFDWPLGLSKPVLEDVEASTSSEISSLTGYQNANFGLSVDGSPPELRWGLEVTDDFFGTLGVQPAAGRLFDSEEAESGEPVAVIGHTLWQDRFEGSPDAVGRGIEIDGQTFTIVGVAERGFAGTEVLFANEIYLPLAARRMHRESGLLEERGALNLKVTARLTPGIEHQQLDRRLEIATANIQAEYSPELDEYDYRAMPESDARVEAGLGSAMNLVATVLLGLVGLVLLIACGNVANLLLARASGRAREMSLRLAIGADRIRLVRQMLIESVVLALGGGVLGLGIALAAAQRMTSFELPSNVPLRLDVQADHRVLVFTLAVSLLAGLIFGIAPALRASRQDPARGLRESPRGGGGRSLRLSNAFVVAQVALSLILLVAAGLFLRSLRGVEQADLGLDPSGLAAVTVDLGMVNKTPEEGRAFYRTVLQRLREMPGTESATIGAYVPMDWQAGGFSLTFDRDLGQDLGNELLVLGSRVGPDYFDTVRTPILEGRAFDVHDDADRAPVAIVNQELADKVWTGESALGKQLRVNGSDEPATVVGVAKTGKYRLPGESPRPYFYVPFEQRYNRAATLVVRSREEPARVVEQMKTEIHGLEPDLVFFNPGPLEEAIASRVLGPVRLMASLAGSFGVLGLVLASIGLYGVMAYTVAMRTREIGVRIALGARAGQVLTRVLGQGLRLALVGVVIGGAVAFAATRVLQTLLVGVSANDPATFLVVVGSLVAVALLAATVPALRATRIDPVKTLKAE